MAHEARHCLLNAKGPVPAYPSLQKTGETEFWVEEGAGDVAELSRPQNTETATVTLAMTAPACRAAVGSARGSLPFRPPILDCNCAPAPARLHCNSGQGPTGEMIKCEPVANASSYS